MINFALNAPAVGTNFPLSVDGTSITGGLIPAANLPLANATTRGAVSLYTENTFVPSLTFGGGSTGITYSTNRYGNYTRIGNRCFFNLYLGVTSKGSSTGSCVITGLPFTAATTANGGFSACSLWAGGVSVSGGALTSYVNQNATSIALEYFSVLLNAAAANAVTDTHWGATGNVLIAGHYIIA